MLSEDVFIQQMKTDLKALGEIGSHAMENGTAPSKDSMAKYQWLFKPLDDQSVTMFAKKYNMSKDEFAEYAHRFKTFYAGK